MILRLLVFLLCSGFGVAYGQEVYSKKYDKKKSQELFFKLRSRIGSARIKQLVAEGANPNYREEPYCFTPLDQVCSSRQVIPLLEAGADPRLCRNLYTR